MSWRKNIGDGVEVTSKSFLLYAVTILFIHGEDDLNDLVPLFQIVVEVNYLIGAQISE